MAQTFENLARTGARELRAFGIENPGVDARILLMHICEKSRAELIAAAHDLVPENIAAQYTSLIARRKTHEPIAYITGRKEFWSLTFGVDGQVLIPRPETELVVEHALKAVSEIKSPRILDVGCGSGVILLSLLSARPDGRGLGVDISRAALARSDKNAHILGLEMRAQFMHSDYLNAVISKIKSGEQEKFDILVANPPYIDGAAMKKLPPDISRYEPQVALYGGEDGLDAYRAITGVMEHVLTPKGCVVFEIGFDQGAAVEAMLKAAGCQKIERFKDFGGHDRVVSGFY